MCASFKRLKRVYRIYTQISFNQIERNLDCTPPKKHVQPLSAYKMSPETVRKNGDTPATEKDKKMSGVDAGTTNIRNRLSRLTCRTLRVNVI